MWNQVLWKIRVDNFKQLRGKEEDTLIAVNLQTTYPFFKDVFSLCILNSLSLLKYIFICIVTS